RGGAPAAGSGTGSAPPAQPRRHQTQRGTAAARGGRPRPDRRSGTGDRRRAHLRPGRQCPHRLHRAVVRRVRARRQHAGVRQPRSGPGATVSAQPVPGGDQPRRHSGRGGLSMLRLALKSLLNRRGTVLLTVFPIAIRAGLLAAAQRLGHEARNSSASTLGGTDLIVGARAGTVQLLLYAVFRLGEPTANVSWQTYQEIAALPEVAWTVPMSLGDSHRGYRVLGTTADYFRHYRYGRSQPLAFAQGRVFEDVFDAVLGAEVARKLGYRLGDEMVLAHGIGRASFANHDDKPFRVAGILAPTGTPVDRTVHVSL